MGASLAGGASSRASNDRGGGSFGGQGFSSFDEVKTGKLGVQVTLEDLELPARREVVTAASAAAQMMGAAPGSQSQPQDGQAQASQPAAAQVQGPRITEEILPGGEARGQKAFREDGLVGTEAQQLQLLAHYAELCEDFRLYQRTTRQEGAALETDGAQLLLLSGPPGTGKTRHAVTFARALGLPLLVAQPPLGTQGGPRSGSAWAAQLRREVQGRDCALFLDEIDQHVGDEGFASGLRQFLDGVCQPSGNKVLLVGTTNRIERLPQDVRHRAEVISFDLPERVHLAEMWNGYAKHLKAEDLQQLASVSANAGATGRDVRHCASLCEREAAIRFLNEQRGMGYCHGAALASCPGPRLEQYLRCVRGRSSE
ncbi:unnamed protein product [Polarella glacialis]|uniref:AAA+ ATPase domain-containing protein n=1 Tax=Polarella glacialis TaxID=89957 RepID=A0A813GU35_POLGL|nr:unnamed protein product [Polarella glacialis]CAE8655352.1 unnamed protein product [Polarella glacialis]